MCRGAFLLYAVISASAFHVSGPLAPCRYLGAFLLYATINAALVFGSVAITVFLGPAAAGSGISEVKVRGPGQRWGQQQQGQASAKAR